ncbi:hypothetical protein BT69DRAFT_1343377 [Atractiella rhizophila]|nr:hypothetical protein BT69DRAFT_1343377 [Atractiella rhizophila]
MNYTSSHQLGADVGRLKNKRRRDPEEDFSSPIALDKTLQSKLSNTARLYLAIVLLERLLRNEVPFSYDDSLSSSEQQLKFEKHLLEDVAPLAFEQYYSNEIKTVGYALQTEMEIWLIYTISVGIWFAPNSDIVRSIPWRFLRANALSSREGQGRRESSLLKLLESCLSSSSSLRKATFDNLSIILQLTHAFIDQLPRPDVWKAMLELALEHFGALWRRSVTEREWLRKRQLAHLIRLSNSYTCRFGGSPLLSEKHYKRFLPQEGSMDCRLFTDITFYSTLISEAAEDLTAIDGHLQCTSRQLASARMS